MLFPILLFPPFYILLHTGHYDGPGKYHCKCNAGWAGTGFTCGEPGSNSPCGPEDCNHNGHCDLFGSCKCEDGYEGSDCSLVKGAHGRCPDQCGGEGNGVCNEEGICVCDPAWRGTSCALLRGFAVQMFGDNMLRLGGAAPADGLPAMKQFTIFMWVQRSEDARTHNHAQTLIASDSSQHSHGSVWIGLYRNTLMVNIGGNSPPSQSFELDEDKMIRGRWHLYGITYNSVTRKLDAYIDHSQIGDDHNENATRVYTTAVPAVLGGGASSGYTTVGNVLRTGGRQTAPFHGSVDDIQVWDTYRNHAFMLAKSSAANQGAHLMGYWPCDEGTGNVAHDLSGNGRHAALTDSNSGTDSPVWVLHSLPSLAVRAGTMAVTNRTISKPQSPEQTAALNKAMSAMVKAVKYGRFVGKPPASVEQPHQGVFMHAERKCNPTTGKGCARCCASLPKDADNKAEFKATALYKTNVSDPGNMLVLGQYDCESGSEHGGVSGDWLCDGINYCHRLNPNEACCTSNADNNTCIKTGVLGQLSYQMVEDQGSLDDADSLDEGNPLGVADTDPAHEGPKAVETDRCGNCGMHGVCLAGPGGAMLCKCDAGYGGRHCDMPSCNPEYSGGDPCSGNGVCHAEEAVCHCKDGYFGKSCAKHIDKSLCVNGRIICENVDNCKCVSSICASGCNQNGKCEDSGKCTCFKGYSGLDCSRRMTCPNECSGPLHGTCDMNALNGHIGTMYRGKEYFGSCNCIDMYAGADCSIVDNKLIDV